MQNDIDIEVLNDPVTPENHAEEGKINEEMVHKAEEIQLVDAQEPKVVASSIRIMLLFGWYNWLLAAGVGIIPIVFFFVMGNGLGSIATASATDVTSITNQLGLNITYIAIAAGFAGFLSNFFFSLAQQLINNNLKQKYYNSCIQQEIGFFDIKKAGGLAHSLSDDVGRATDVYSTQLQTMTQCMAQVVVGFILAMTSNWAMTLLIMCSVPLMFFNVIVFRKLLSFLATKISTLMGDSVSTANEVIGSMRTVRSMAGEEKEALRYSQNLNNTRKYSFVNSLVKGLTFGPIAFYVWGAVALGFWWGGVLIQRGDLQTAEFIKVYGFCLMTVIGLQQIIAILPEIIRAQASGAILLKVILRKPAIPFRGGVSPDLLQGKISFQNVTFRYPARPNVAVLKNFNLEIAAGTSVALVGQSGSGKSTIVGLVEKWYEPESGVVTVDGVDIRDIDSLWLHRYLGIVSQEPTLFATTIRRNISYAVDTINGHIRDAIVKGNKYATDQDIDSQLIPINQQIIENAAIAANCHEFITKLPDGYDTIIGERGVSLSGGQKQRIAIARAVLQDPKMLLLDEATSALDTKSEALVQDALDKLMKGRTSIVIAHRLTTIQDCDNIVVMRQGEVVEMGTHHEMLNRVGGPYYNLAIKQMKFGNHADTPSTNTNTSTDDTASDTSIDRALVEHEKELLEDQSLLQNNNTVTGALTNAPDTIAKVDRSIADQPGEIITALEKKKKKKRRRNDQFTNEVDVVDVHEPKNHNPFYIFSILGAVDSVILLIGLFGSACLGATPILSYYFFGQMINASSPVRNADGSLVPFPPGYRIDTIVARNAGWLAIVAGGTGIAQFLNQFMTNLANERLNVKARRIYFSSIIKQEMGFFDIKKTGKLLATLGEDIQSMNDGITLKAALFLQHITQCILGVILALVASWKTGLVMMGAGIPTIGASIVIGGMFVGITTKLIMAASGSALASSTEVIGAIRTVRSMAGEEREMRRFGNDLAKIRTYGFYKALVMGFMMASIQFFIWGVAALAFWYGGTLVGSGELQAGSLLQVFGNMLLGVLGASLALSEVQHFFKSKACLAEVAKVTKRKPAIPFKGGIVPETVVGCLEFKNITFSYPSRPNVTVMKDFSLTISQGQHVALVGESGCGKSTLTGLIERFYEPSSGITLLDGVDLSKIDPQWLHRNVAIVTQEPVLFATTIRKNITYAVGDDTVTQERVVQCAKDANCHDFIMNLPNGYDTMVGERGVSMSGGQKQRIAIARAMIQDSKMLLLDEATSALDTEAESLVQSALDKLMVGKTTIVIAHRLSTIKDCDVIVAMKSGVVMEMGTHDELVARKGMYYKLAQKQMQFGQGHSASSVNLTEDD
ncbi:ATP-binding cassette, subfamily B (MDR/TAP), member ABCB1 [Acrasis kona]|uniref:ATP-binding cassette, subfamily B (MDR/TAP), member ABCB1 n=1 Tax=Acrasis kona TaxID=1008807 RepID=A0AAW2YU18_9EUKA